MNLSIIDSTQWDQETKHFWVTTMIVSRQSQGRSQQFREIFMKILSMEINSRNMWVKTWNSDFLYSLKLIRVQGTTSLRYEPQRLRYEEDNCTGNVRSRTSHRKCSSIEKNHELGKRIQILHATHHIDYNFDLSSGSLYILHTSKTSSHAHKVINQFMGSPDANFWFIHRWFKLALCAFWQ